MLHIFDVDKTVYRGSTVLDFLIMGFSDRFLSWALFWTLPVLTVSFLFNRGNEAVTGKEFPFLKNLSRKKMEAMSLKIFKKRIQKRLNPEMLAIIHSVQAKKEEIVLATSSFRVLIEPIAEFLKADYLVSTELEYSEGITTGKLDGVPAFGEGKKEKIEELLSRKGLTHSEFSFYSDSHRDLPLLEIAGLAVAVNPDWKLKRTALKRGWRIINTNKKGSLC